VEFLQNPFIYILFVYSLFISCIDLLFWLRSTTCYIDPNCSCLYVALWPQNMTLSAYDIPPAKRLDLPLLITIKYNLSTCFVAHFSWVYFLLLLTDPLDITFFHFFSLHVKNHSQHVLFVSYLTQFSFFFHQILIIIINQTFPTRRHFFSNFISPTFTHGPHGVTSLTG
jgi:hypothetical protein